MFQIWNINSISIKNIPNLTLIETTQVKKQDKIKNNNTIKYTNIINNIGNINTIK